MIKLDRLSIWVTDHERSRNWYVTPQSWWRPARIGGLSRAFFPRGRGEGEGDGEGANLARVTSVRLACCSRASNTACHTASS